MAAPMFVLLLAAVAGVWAAEALTLEPYVGLAFFAASAIALIRVFWRAAWPSDVALRSTTHHTGWALCAVASGYAALAAQVHEPEAPMPAQLERAAGGARFRARIVAPLTRRCAGGRCRLITQLELLSVADEKNRSYAPAKGRVSIALMELTTPAARGDGIEVVLRRKLMRPRSPWSPSRAALARRTGAHAQLLEAIAPHATWSYAAGWQAQIDRRRLRLARDFDSMLGAAAAGIVRALTLGDLGGLGVGQRQAWADAGLAHLLAISGLHVGLIFALCVRALSRAVNVFVSRGCRRAPFIVTLLSLGAVWLYVLLAAVPTAALRAALMLTVASGARACQRPAAGLQILGVCGLFIVTLWPLEAVGPSFVLSFAAVAGLLGAGNDAFVLAEPSALKQSCSPLRRGWTRLCDGVRMSLIATLTTLPACMHFFGRVSWVGPLANIFAVPVAAMVATPIALGAAASLCLATWLTHSAGFTHLGAFVSTSLVPLALRLLEPLLALLDRWAAWCAKLGGGALMLPPQGKLGEAGWVLVASALMLWGATRLAGRWAFVSLLAGTALLACGDAYDATLGAHPGVLQIYHLDVGQGDATLLRLPGGQDVLVDSGGALYGDAPDPGQWAVAPALVALGVRKLAGVLVTHAHPDHMGGLAHVLSRWPCEVLWRSRFAHESFAVQQLERRVVSQGGSVALPPSQIEWGGATLRFVGALADTEASANDHSTVLEVSFRNRRVTLLADVEHAAERELVAQLLPTEIIKVGHHGSRTSSHADLLAHLAPQIGVISCGANNSFGFPHPESVARLERNGVTLLRTDRLGTIGYATDGGPWRLIAADGAWQDASLMAWARAQQAQAFEAAAQSP